jgi:hypothetical protein
VNGATAATRAQHAAHMYTRASTQGRRRQHSRIAHLLQVRSKDEGRNKAGARATKRETTGPKPGSTGNTIAQQERARTRERSGAESNTAATLTGLEGG